jgi:hypothetical protein
VNGAAIQITGGSTRSITVDANFIHDFDCPDNGAEADAGIYVNRAGSGQQLTNNRIIRRAAGPHFGGSSNCILVRSDSSVPSGGGHRIAANYLQGCYDGIGTQSEDDPRGGLDGGNSIVESNTVLDAYDDCIQIEGGTQGVVVRNNHLERCSIGIANAPNYGVITFEGNTIVNGVVGDHGSVMCFKVGNAYQGTGNTPAAGLARYINNRCYLPTGSADGWAETNPGLNPFFARGNRIHVSRYVIEFIRDPNEFAPSSFDTNCLYTNDPDRFVKWDNATYFNLQSFRNATGMELSGTEIPTCAVNP